jgi:hypothetical protein
MTPFSFLRGATFAGGLIKKFIIFLQFLAKNIYQYLIVQKYFF